MNEDIPLLTRKFKDIAANWDLYGSMLSIPNAKLQAIKRRDTLPSSECMVRMLQMWRENNGDSASYQMLYQAAKNMEHNSLANQIQRAHPNLQERGIVGSVVLNVVLVQQNNWYMYRSHSQTATPNSYTCNIYSCWQVQQV